MAILHGVEIAVTSSQLNILTFLLNAIKKVGVEYGNGESEYVAPFF